MNDFFMINRRAGLIRIIILILLGGSLWALWAYLDHPFTRGAEPLTISILVYSAQALFAASIMRMVIMIVLGIWLAYQIAGHYLDYIFQLNDISAAGKFLRQASFASEYDMLDIRDGNVAFEHHHLPLYRIGGPGKIRVYLENAAVYEKIAGKTSSEPHIIGPTVSTTNNPQTTQTPTGYLRNLINSIIPLPANGQRPKDSYATIEGFERLREVVDLRNQVLSSLKVVGRTRDGIRVNACDVHAFVHVQRGKPGSDQSAPYLYQDTDVIKKYIYRKTFGNDPDLVNLVNYTVEKTIENKVLDDFLSSTNNETEKTGNKLTFNMLSGLQSSLDERGLDISWIGEGTWETPDVDMTGRHLEAWQISRDNRLRASQPILNGLHKQARVLEFLRLLQEIPISAYHHLCKENGSQVIQLKTNLVIAYRDQMQSALDIFKLEGKENDPDAILLKETIKSINTHLYHLLSELYDRSKQLSTDEDQSPDSEDHYAESDQEPAPAQAESQPGNSRSKSPNPDERELYNRLIKKANGDKDLVDKRIMIEMERMTSSSVADIMNYLYDHWTEGDQ